MCLYVNKCIKEPIESYAKLLIALTMGYERELVGKNTLGLKCFSGQAAE